MADYKTLTSLLMLFLTVTMTLTVQPAHASAPKPATPEIISIKYDDHYGEAHVVHICVKNQDVAPYKDPVTGQDYELYFNVSYTFPDAEYFPLRGLNFTDENNLNIILPETANAQWLNYYAMGRQPSTSEDTTLTIYFGDYRMWEDHILLFPHNSGRWMAFRVQAVFGYYTVTSAVPGFKPTFSFTGVSSGWTDGRMVYAGNLPPGPGWYPPTQVETAPSSSASPKPTTQPTQNPPATPNQQATQPKGSPENGTIMVTTVTTVVVIALVVIIAIMRRRISLLERRIENLESH
ncbi:MAG: hypothetical protein NWE92_05540 [Candidatus Bathyarchaeota archaeon]|nr:hypothetical protein [Candidatus Bathyarchaeota archaeon]